MKYDKYYSTINCIKRLVDTYVFRGYLIIAFDFDDTIFSSDPEYKCEYPIKLLQRCKNELNNTQLILYTCRSSNKEDGKNLKYAIKMCKHLNIEPDFVNKHAYEEYKGLNGKVYYDLFLDDKAGLGQACDILEEALNIIKHKL